MATSPEYYNVQADDPVDNTEEESATTFTPRVKTKVSLPRLNNTSDTTRKTRTVLSLYDENKY